MNRRTFLFRAGAVALLAPLTRKSFAAAPEPLLAPWTGPYGGVPRFDRIRVQDFPPAFEKAMRLARAEHAAIAAVKQPATFANTIVAYESSGRPMARAKTIFETYTNSMNGPAMQVVQKEMAPRLAAFADEVTQDRALFARIHAVHEARAGLGLDAEQLRLVETHHQSFAHKGAALDAADQARLREVNQKLANAYTTFSQNLLADEEQDMVVLEAEADLAGLPESVRAAMRGLAEGRKLSGKWVVSNTRSAVAPFLTYAARRDLREKVWRMWTARGDHGPHDNKPVIVEILALRAARAKLLGFPSHAHWTLDDNMARTPDAAMALMLKVWKAAAARVREEVADMQAIADGEKAGIRIAAWDYQHYAEKVRKARYDLDQEEVRGYLQLDKLREAMVWAAGKLYGLAFAPARGVPVYHPDVTTYQVTRGGKRVGLWYFDPYAKPGKRSGAWMSEYRAQEAFRERVTPVVSNNANFVKGAAGAPLLISWDDAKTMFHEFGHALHGLLSAVRYPTLAGTRTKNDFVEFPSQLNEHWLSTPEVLSRFCVHHQTGKPIPAELVAKIVKARSFNQGYETATYLASAIYDLEIHMQPAGEKIDPAAFEQALLKKLDCPPEIGLRHRPPAFHHSFKNDDYSAGYYVYLWADTLTADAAEAFVEAGSFYDAATAKRLHDSIMSVGNSIPPEEAFRRFRGRDANTDALMRSRNFPTG